MFAGILLDAEEKTLTLFEKMKGFFLCENPVETWIGRALFAVLLSVMFYYVFKILKDNKATKFIAVVVGVVLGSGCALMLLPFDSSVLLISVLMIILIIFTMFNTEIKRSLLDANVRHTQKDSVTVSNVEIIMEEMVRAIQNMSKKDVGAFIVLSDENLPEGIIESGTVVNAKITSQMIEAVFYPKAPLHDGAMIIEGNKIYAAGCFVPIVQNENLPKDMGSRHRAALGVTAVASVTAIVVSEETGIISIMRNGEVVKKYADATDIKSALSDYYWSDLTAED